MERTLLITIFVFVMMFSLVSAGTPQEPDDYFKLTDRIDYSKPCINGGTYCSNSAQCNITAWYPNKTRMISNKLMTNQYYYHNYTLPAFGDCGSYCGIYKIDISCMDGGNNATRTFYAEVNPTGIKPTDQRTATTGRAVWVLFVIAISLFIGFMFVQHPTAKYVMIIMAMIMMVAGINVLFTTLYQEVTDQGLLNLFDFISAASFYFYWLAFGLIIIILFMTGLITLFDRYNKTKLVKYGD